MVKKTYPANTPEMKKFSQQANSRIFTAKKHYVPRSITVLYLEVFQNFVCIR